MKTKSWFKKLVYILSSLGLLSTFGYYLINIENKALGRQPVSQITITKPDVLKAKLKYVVDGDTIKVATKDGKEVTVRLLGIDSPEMSGSPRASKRGVADCMANEATEALRGMLRDGELTLKTDPNQSAYDKYGRLLAYVFISDDNKSININQQMIRQGYAYEYTYKGRVYKYQQEFKNAQKEAKLNHLGLWIPGVCR